MTKKLLILTSIGVISFILISNCQAAFDYNYANPIDHSSLTDFLLGLLGNIYGYVGSLAVLFIVIGGVMYMTAGGKESQLTLAKKTIVFALIGMGLALGGSSLLKEIMGLFPAGGGPLPDFSEANSVYEILLNILDFVLTLIVVLASLALVYSGISYLGARGDSSRVDKAKKTSIYSIISLSVAGGSLILIRFILNLLEGTL